MDIVSTLVGLTCGTSAVLFVAKLYIAKALKDLERALNMCHSINIKLAGINVQLESLEKLSEVVYDHDRKISALEFVARRRKSGDHFSDTQ